MISTMFYIHLYACPCCRKIETQIANWQVLVTRERHMVILVMTLSFVTHI